jgi:hypothetical protein
MWACKFNLIPMYAEWGCAYLELCQCPIAGTSVSIEERLIMALVGVDGARCDPQELGTAIQKIAHVTPIIRKPSYELDKFPNSF